MKIVLATTSKTKRECLEEVLKELQIEAEIFVEEVESGVSPQPMTSKETKKGSLNRAKKAIKLQPEVDFSLGVEVGYHPN
ncbi:MAG: inosine/xanthosine triphosphatase, partial [Patescibacteria group bacterium]|nr:inosine/xanthosine triphosphatase [Patescibacteria group bacterium]